MVNIELRGGMCVVVALAGWMFLAGGGARGQAGAAQSASPTTTDKSSVVQTAVSAELPAWDVSTVKPSDPNATKSMLWFTPDGIRITNVPLAMVVRVGLNLEDDRIFGVPAWAKTTRFDIEAKVAPEDVPKLKDMKMDERRGMLVTLLVDRFMMKYHSETREMPVYNLVVAKSGVKMAASKPNSDEKGSFRMMIGSGHFESQGTGMDLLVRSLSQALGRTVVDKTGLIGKFDYKLDWTPDNAAPVMTKSARPDEGSGAEIGETSGPSLFTATQEQLGLKLEAAKGPVEVVVVDQLEQPTAN